MKSSYFKELLQNEYMDGVEAQIYTRIPYKDWRSIMRYDDNRDLFIEIEMDLSYSYALNVPMRIKILDENDNIIYSSNNEDNSIGAFLYNYFKEKKIDTYIKNYVTTNTNSIYAADTLKTTVNTNDITIKDTPYYPPTNTAGSLYIDNVKIGDFTIVDDKSKSANSPNKEKEEGNKMMKMFDFGPCDDSKVHMSMYGIAIKNSNGTWVSYDKTNKNIIDVDVMNFNAGKFMYKVPVAVHDVKIGDVVVHNHVPMFVIETNENTLTVIDVYAGEQKNILPTKNMFGFNFITKVVSVMDMNGCGSVNATEDNPFGKMLPFLIMGDKADIDPMMFMMMSGNGFDMSNPMMLYFMMKDGGKGNDMLPLFLMMGQNKPAHKCECGKDATCNCGKPPVKE